MSETKRLRVTLVYEYDVEPEHYSNGADPLAMAQEDLDGDAAALLMDADSEIERAVFVSGESR